MALGLPDYHTIVRRPADLGTIRARLLRGAAQVPASTTVSADMGPEQTAILCRLFALPEACK